MNCGEIRDLISDLEARELPPEAREHLSKCAGCEAALRRARLLHAGFAALAEETVPEASLGFASRVVRRLAEWEEKGARSEFFETVGRRFVYATLALMLALLLSLALPNSGPIRGVGGADFLGLQADSQSSQPDVVGGDFMEPHEGTSGRLTN